MIGAGGRRVGISLGEFVSEEALSPLLLGERVGDLPVAIIEEIEDEIVGGFHYFRVERQRLQESQERSFVVHLCVWGEGGDWRGMEWVSD